MKLVAVFEHRDVFARYHRDHREDRPVRLPAFGAAAGVIVGDITLDADLDRPILAFASQGSGGEVAGAFLNAAVNRWVDMNCHGLSSCLVFWGSKYDDRTDRLALMHQIETFVDLFQLENMGDHRIDLDFPVHVPVHDLRHVGPAACAAKCRALPDAAGDELEWPG